jgi:hypothetical protein
MDENDNRIGFDSNERNNNNKEKILLFASKEPTIPKEFVTNIHKFATRRPLNQPF